MKFQGRRVLLAPTEPVPASMRLAPGILVVTAKEFRDLEREDAPTQLALQTIIHDIEAAELLEKLKGAGK